LIPTSWVLGTTGATWRNKSWPSPWLLIMGLHHHSAWIPAGTLILERLIISPTSSTSFIPGSNTNGKDHVQTTNGAGMHITHIGQSILTTLSHPLHLKNVHHVPSVTRNLLSVKKNSQDNNVFFEFHPWYLFIKDRGTRAVLLEGGCRGGLYNLDVSSASKHVFNSVKASRSRWHSRLGHLATQIV
jgi:hypothetical protein